MSSKPVSSDVTDHESDITHRCRVDATTAPAEFPLNRRRLKDSARHARIIGENTDPFCPEISHEVIEWHFSPGKLAVVWINVDEEGNL